MEHEVLTSICIPTYGRTTYLRQAIEGCINQSYHNVEILVHDDSGADDVARILADYPSNRVRHIRHEPGMGLVKKLNAFLEEARGEWAVIVGDDDEIEPDFLRNLLQLAEDDPDAVLMRCRNRLIDSNGKQLHLDLLGPRVASRYEFIRDIFLSERDYFRLNITGIMFKPASLLRHGGFVEMHGAWHVDRIAFVQLGSEGNTYCTDEVLCNIRLHATSATSGLRRDYKLALESNMAAREIFTQVIDDLETTAETEEDRQNLATARVNLTGYMERQMAESFKHGFLAVVEDEDINARKAVNALFSSMKSLHVPLTPPSVFYGIVGYFPYSVRMWLLAGLRFYLNRRIGYR